MKKKPMLAIKPLFCSDSSADKPQHPYDTVEWVKRDVHFDGKDGVIFHQDDVERPAEWSDQATFITASKYFRGHIGTKKRESSVKHLFDRVVDTITEAGILMKYFDKTNGKIFNHEIKKILVDQRAAFNSPVFFNVGAAQKAQGSACFVLDVKDDLKSIANLQSVEIDVFSQGSGTGVNLSPLRSAMEPLTDGGWASGPLSFFKGYNAWGGVIRSGGILRRASKLNRLDDWHNDIYNGKEDGTDFLSFKAQEERKARALVLAGYSVEEAYATVSGQNANLSVGLSDEFMRAALEGREWPLRYVKSKEISRTVNAKKILDSLVKNCHFCGDPGIQFHSAINHWHTCPKSGEILCSNPCSEYFFLPNSACNLASINLSKFISLPEGLFFEEEFCQAVRLLVIAQDILVDLCSYPTEEITTNSKEFRPLGLGFTNLGGMVMALGLPYDSQEARMWASSISALLTGVAYGTSIEIAKIKGPFKQFEKNKRSMIRVLKQHEDKLDEVLTSIKTEFGEMISRTRSIWSSVVKDTSRFGIRNAQTTLLAPTGTIALMMDASTTGVESGNWLTTKKRLVDGGILTMPLKSAPVALDTLGYSEADKIVILDYIKKTSTVEGCPRLKREHLPVFDTAYENGKSKRSISSDGHLLMLAACQPFISGGISKTIGRPKSATANEFREIAFKAWKLGLKSISIYRDGTKMAQPLSGAKKDPQSLVMASHKRSMPRRRSAESFSTRIGQTKLYTIVGFYPDDKKVGEIFLRLGKAGSALTGWVDALALAISIGLQYQIPMEVFVDKFSDLSFDPRGFTNDPDIRFAKSVPDYVVRLLAQYDKESRRVLGLRERENEPRLRDTAEIPTQLEEETPPKQEDFLGDLCPQCGNLMVRINATCRRCPHCSNSEGSCGG